MKKRFSSSPTILFAKKSAISIPADTTAAVKYFPCSTTLSRVARAIQLAIEYNPQPIFHSGNYFNSEEKLIKIAEKKLTNDAKKELGILGLLKHSKNILKIMK